MASEVFRPSNGPLFVRSNLASGVPESADKYRKDRPESQCGYRFGQLSHNSFFARHNPHPSRVRHLKGLLDVPICAVQDDGYVSNPRFSLNFPPNNHDDTKVSTYYSKYYPNNNNPIPVNAINVNSQRHPINTITGLQYFQGKPLNMRIFREKAIPKVGMVPVTESWRDELLALTKAVAQPQASGLSIPVMPTNQVPTPPAAKKPRTSQYSAETGRLIPPPSRAMSRGGPSRSGSQAHEKFMDRLNQISEDPELELQIMQMLCQILQTDDINAVKAWLVNGSEREKEQVLNMIRGALQANEQYYKQDPKANNYKVTEEIGKTLGDNDNLDRLTLDEDENRPKSAIHNRQFSRPASQTARKIPSPIKEQDEMSNPPVLPDIFKPPKTPSLKYTRVDTPKSEEDRFKEMIEDKEHVWEPSASLAVKE